MQPDGPIKQRIVKALSGFGRVERGEDDTPEALKADVINLRAAVRELQQAVIELAEELDRRNSSS